MVSVAPESKIGEVEEIGVVDGKGKDSVIKLQINGFALSATPPHQV
jgi:hypothetical protein